MSDLFRKSEIETAMTFEDIRLLSHQAAGLPVPNATPVVEVPRDNRPPNAERVLYLSGNSRIVITSADGEGALDAIEARLRASLGAK